jgi:putative hydrolase of the HAD superfamily
VGTGSVQAIIFDLDNCLVPGDAIGGAAYEPAFDAIRRANDGRLSDAELAAAFADMWRHPLGDVARSHRFTPGMLAAGWQVFAHMEARAPLQGYADLGVLAELTVPRFLVTTGFRRLQESKIAALGLRDLFTEIRIDVVDEPDRRGKQQLFHEIRQAHGYVSRQMLVVGDNAESEIRAGNELGMTTVQILRPGVPYGSNAAHHIHGLQELRRYLA